MKQSREHSLPLNLVPFNRGLAGFVETLEGVPVLFGPDAVLDDAQQGAGEIKGGLVLKAQISFHMSLSMSSNGACGISSVSTAIQGLWNCSIRSHSLPTVLGALDAASL